MDIGAAIALSQQIIDIVVKVSPAISRGAVSSVPYVQALAGMIMGSNATQEQVDAMLAQLEADSADFQQPLPADDGTTTT